LDREQTLRHSLTLRWALATALVVIAIFEHYTRPVAVALPVAAQAPSSVALLLDHQGAVLQRLRVDMRQRQTEWVALSEMSPALVKAALTLEDQRFFRHSGVDAVALAHAFWQNRQRDKTQRGASTITMQLYGLLSGQSGPSRPSQPARRGWLEKLTQMRGAWALERGATKTQLLEAYFNTVSYRGELKGIHAAAAGLFGKVPIGLDAEESALLASLIAMPQAKISVVAARACRQLPKPCDASLLPTTHFSRPLGFSQADQIAPHAAARLLAQATAGHSVVSSLDQSIQRIATTALGEQMRELASARVEDGAIVVLNNQTGEVLAYVGSSGDYSQAAEVDAAAALRQAGSTLKPFLYAQAIAQKRITAASLLDDSPLAIQTNDAQYVPRNYSHDFKGWVSVRKALASSMNIPAVRTLGLLDADQFVELLKQVGLKRLNASADFYGLSLALGSADVSLLELTNAYRTLANQGVYSPVSFFPQAAHPGTAVLNAQASFIVADILADNEARSSTFGIDSVLRLPFRSSVKTGTSKDMRDNWCIGFSRDFTVGVWVGNASGTPMRAVSGVAGAAPIWRSVMLALHQRQPQSNQVKKPLDLTQAAVQFERQLEPARQEYFVPGTAVQQINLAILPARAINHPLDGAIYALDPDIPAQRQTVVFEHSIEPRSDRAQWELNGQLIGQSQRISWALKKGRHQLRLVTVGGAVVDQIGFEVR
jgi:penicillin-binding protein 1C